MFNFARIRSIAIPAAVLVGAAVSFSALATHTWNNYHWARTTAQFTLQLGDNLSSDDWKGHLAKASSDWNSPESFGASSTPILTAIVAGGANRRCSMVKGTTQVCSGKYGNNGWLGLATIYISGEHITQGSAKMNDTYFTTARYNNTNERQHVICQEVAHTFGLDHQSTDGSSQNSCMDYFSNTGANATSTLSISPNKHDFDELNIIYKHLDSTTTVASGAASAGSRTPDLSDDPTNWGTLMRQSADGRSSIYERYNRDGTLTLTHVYWTEETAAACPSCDHRVYR